MKQIIINPVVLWGGGVTAILIVFFVLFSPVLLPFIMGTLIAYILAPLVCRLEYFRINRSLAVLIVILLTVLFACSVLLLLVPILAVQLRRAEELFPRIILWLQDKVLPWIESTTGFDITSIDHSSLWQYFSNNWQDIGSVAKVFFPHMAAIGQSIFVTFSFLVLVPVISFYVLRDWNSNKARIIKFLPVKVRAKTIEIAIACDRVLGAFLHGQIMIMFLLALFYGIGLAFLGLETGFLVGVFAGLISFIPYVGVVVGFVLSMLMALAQAGSVSLFLMIAVLFLIASLIESFILSPLVVGDRVGLHPLVVIFALFAGGSLLGFIGVLMAIPVAAILAVLLNYILDYLAGHPLYRDTIEGDHA